MIPDGASDGRIVDPVWLLRAKIAPTGVTLDKTSLSLRKGETYTLTATVAPANATDKTVAWSSGNTNVATVDGKGKVTGVAAGNALVTAKTADGNRTAVCAVTVTDIEIDLSGLGLVDGVLKLEPGQEVDVTIPGTPEGLKFMATGLPAGLTLTEGGRLYGKVPQPGNYPVTLTITASDGTSITETFVVEVTDEGVKGSSSGGCAGPWALHPLWGAVVLMALASRRSAKKTV